MVAAPLAGMRLVFVAQGARPYVFELLRTLRQIPCQRLVASPILIRHLVRLGDRAQEGLRNLQAIYSTGASLNLADVEALHARLGIPIVNYYGLTETGGICVAQALAGWRPDDHSLGMAAGAQLRVMTDDGHVAAAGTGELEVRSPQLMSGYLDDPQRTAARFNDGWLKTGDRVRIDAEGRCHLLGRIEGFLKSGTADKVAPEEIEAVLELHPAVAEAAALGVFSDREGCEQIVALVAPRLGVEAASASGLTAFVRERLGPARTPAHIQFIDGLPRRRGGKIVRTELPGLLRQL
jgi:long-chain acyl-CoA synthetase